MSTAAVVLALALLATGAAEPGATDWRQVADCVGRTCAVAGTVVSQEVEDGVTRLYFDLERRDVSVLLVHSLFKTWPDYRGRRIVATGEVRRFREQIEVVVWRERDVEFAAATTPRSEPQPTVAATLVPEPAPEPSPAPTPTAETAEVERLRRRVEELEQRVRELEPAR